MDLIAGLIQVFVDESLALTETVNALSDGEIGQIVVLYFKNWQHYWDFLARLPYMSMWERWELGLL
jgi:hypothetical protein